MLVNALPNFNKYNFVFDFTLYLYLSKCCFGKIDICENEFPNKS